MNYCILHLFVLFSLSVDWMMPTRTGEGHLLYSSHLETPSQTHPEIVLNLGASWSSQTDIEISYHSWESWYYWGRWVQKKGHGLPDDETHETTIPSFSQGLNDLHIGNKCTHPVGSHGRCASQMG